MRKRTDVQTAFTEQERERWFIWSSSSLPFFHRHFLSGYNDLVLVVIHFKFSFDATFVFASIGSMTAVGCRWSFHSRSSAGSRSCVSGTHRRNNITPETSHANKCSATSVCLCSVSSLVTVPLCAYVGMNACVGVCVKCEHSEEDRFKAIQFWETKKERTK